jgi:hypothetical protein
MSIRGISISHRHEALPHAWRDEKRPNPSSYDRTADTGSKGCSLSGTMIPSIKLASPTSRIDMNASLNANAKLSYEGLPSARIRQRSIWASNGIKLVEPISIRIKL